MEAGHLEKQKFERKSRSFRLKKRTAFLSNFILKPL